MTPELPLEAAELRAAASRAFATLGGVDLARRAEADPGVRVAEVGPLLDELGIDDLDPRADGVAMAAAAGLCEAAGAVALPYPIAAVLVRDEEGRPTAAVSATAARVDHGDLLGQWRIGSIDGRGGIATQCDSSLGTRLGPFVTDLEFDDSERSPAAIDLLIQMMLTAWTVLGTVDRAVALAVEHVNGRVQFGRPIAAFQAVQFQLADCAVAVAGLRELAGFTLWRLDTAGAGARGDVLALRLHALEVARAVLRTCQQLHGAAGVCDEYDVSVLIRMVQPALRLPFGVDRAAEELAAVIRADGFEGLFPHGAAAL